MSEVFGKVVIIIGVSSGFGEVMVKMFVDKGVKLVLGVCCEDCFKKFVDEIEFLGG